MRLSFLSWEETRTCLKKSSWGPGWLWTWFSWEWRGRSTHSDWRPLWIGQKLTYFICISIFFFQINQNNSKCIIVLQINTGISKNIFCTFYAPFMDKALKNLPIEEKYYILCSHDGMREPTGSKVVFVMFLPIPLWAGRGRGGCGGLAIGSSYRIPSGGETGRGLPRGQFVRII